MKKNIHFFDQGEANVKPPILERIGIRGRLAMELADLDLPILPGFVIDADVAAHRFGLANGVKAGDHGAA